MKKRKLRHCTNDSLVDLFEYAICYNHYDPMGDMRKPNYSINDIRRELDYRLQNYER